MSALTVFPEHQPDSGQTWHDFEAIAARLDTVGVQFERWNANMALPHDADQETVLAAYRNDVHRLCARYGFQSVDVVSLHPDHPEAEPLRQKFLAEHIHDDFEVRFFIAGRGLFYLHIGDEVHVVLCEQGDLISVPAHTKHWFDMGIKPDFKCIRFFTKPDGWQATFTGDSIAERFPDFDHYLATWA